MEGKVINFKPCSPLKHYHALTEKCHAVCHDSHNLPLVARLKTLMHNNKIILIHLI